MRIRRIHAAMLTTGYKHIELEDDGTAYIAGTSYKVHLLILNHLAPRLEPSRTSVAAPGPHHAPGALSNSTVNPVASLGKRSDC